MPIKIKDFIQKMLSTTNEEEKKLYEKLLAEMKKKMLKADRTMRILIWNSPNFGHQANTIHVMRHFLRTFKPNAGEDEIEVIYDDDEENDQCFGSMREKLQILVPFFNKEIPARQTVNMEGVSVCFIPFDDHQKLEEMNYGLTGGFDHDNISLNKEFITKMFWKLQPYKWHRPSAFYYKNQMFSFDEILESRASGPYSDMVYSYEPVDYTLTKEVLDWYTGQFSGEKLGQNTIMAKCLFETKNPEKLLWPIYGIHAMKAFSIIPELLLKFIISGLLTARSLKKPVLMVLLCDFKEDTASLIDFLTLFLLKDVVKAKSVLIKYIEEIKHLRDYYRANSNANMYNFTDPILDSIPETIWSINDMFDPLDNIIIHSVITEALITKINQDTSISIHVLFLGNVPMPVFQKFFSEADLPPVFEGQGTSSMMISSGKPFIQFNGGNNGGINNYNVFGDPYGISQTLQKNASMLIPPAEKKEDLIASIGEFSSFLNSCYDKQYESYFQHISQQSRNIVNDKFLMGMITGWGLVRREIENYKKNVMPEGLDDILQQLREAASSGVLDVDRVFAETSLQSSLKDILGEIRITGESMEVTPEYCEGILSKVIFRNARTEVYGINMDAELEFVQSMDGWSIESTFRCESLETWEFLPWVHIQQVGFEMTVSENGLPPYGAITGHIGEIETKFRLLYPTRNGKWNLEARFDTPQTAMDIFFKLSGNLNFLESLPPGLKELSGIGVDRLRFLYDTNEEKLQEIIIGLSAKEEWIFHQNPNLSVKPSVELNILNPTSFDTRSISGKVTGVFRIGDGEDAGELSVTACYPPFKIQAQLTKNKIFFSDLLRMFVPHAQMSTSLAISALQMYIEPEVKSYSIYGAIDTDLEVVEGFKITGMSAGVFNTSGQVMARLKGTMQILPKTANLLLRLEAYYHTGAGFRFMGTLESGGETKVSDLIAEYAPHQLTLKEEENVPQFPLGKIQAVFESESKRWSFEAGSKEPWKIQALNDLKLSAKVKIGTIPPKGKETGIEEFCSMLKRDEKDPFFASVWAEFSWENVDLIIWYNYSGIQKNYGLGITCKGIGSASLTPDEGGGHKAEIELDPTLTVGGLIRQMITWCTGSPFGLEEPWNLLEKIPLGGMKLIYHFRTKEVEFFWDIGAIDLGIARIDSIRFTYASDSNDSRKKGLFVDIKGSFVWDKGDSLRWDASKPGQAPVPPASGTSYFTLRTLAMGQHLLIPGLDSAASVEKAMEAVEQSFEPATEEKLPPVSYCAKSSWLFAADFGILKEKGETAYMIDAQVVFNDPNIYALRLRLNGTAAKVFKGLDVQVLYRKVTDSIGVFQAEVTLPDKIRYLNIGAYSLTLPVFGISIYTNGDFQVDVGFPWNGDFTRSMAVEAIVYPGIPIMGAAGFYFGKLSDETAGDAIPHTSKGRFQPVIIFGFGLQVGLGKSVHYGILSAGFSLTVYAILEGVLAKYNPYQIAVETKAKDEISKTTDLSEDYYFRLTGTAGISGHLFGSIDFAIIKAEVDISIQIGVQFTFEVYRPVVLTVMASLSASLSLQINLGIFKIKIHFNFSIKIKESFQIGEIQEAPWDELMTENRGVIASPVNRRLSKMAKPEDYCWNFSALKEIDVKTPLSGFLMVSPVLAADEWGETEDRTCLAVMLLLESLEAFPAFVERFACFLVAAIQTDASCSEKDVKEMILSKKELDWMIDFGLASTQENLTPLSKDHMERFLKEQFEVTVLTKPKEDGEINAVYFPVPGGLSLKIGSKVSSVEYTFGSYNQVAEGKLLSLRRMFDELAVKVAEEDSKNNMGIGDGNKCSMGEFLFADYFLLLGRQVAQALREQLRNYQFLLSGKETIKEILTWVKSESGTDYSIYDIMAGNMEHPLKKDKILVISEGQTYQIKEGDTLQSIIRGNGLEIEMLARTENEAVSGLFHKGEGEQAMLNLPHLEQLRLVHLLAEIKRNRSVEQIAGMVSRYHMHGLRIPTEGITPLAGGMWEKQEKGKWLLPETAGLYALTGQQFQVPVDLNEELSILFNAANVMWLGFESWKNGTVKSDKIYEIIIAPNDETVKRLSFLKAAGKEGGVMENSHLDILDMKSEQPVTASFANPVNWKPDTSVVLPVKGEATVQFQTYPLPDEMQGSDCLYYAAYEEAEGVLKKERAVNYGWGTSLTFSICRNTDNVEGACTYEMIGMKQTQTKQLEKLLENKEQYSICNRMIGYTSSTGNLYQMECDGPNAVDMAMLRLNLSTETHPSGLGDQQDSNMQKFLELLWEGSVTNSGGYYLYYWNNEKKRGLPESAFKEDGTASLTLVLVYDSAQYKGGDYINTLLCGYLLEKGTFPLASADDGRVIVSPMTAPGVLSLGCQRLKPTETEDIHNIEDGKQFLSNQFSLLSYKIVENKDFKGSNYGMPCGPIGERTLLYKTSLPYSSFAKEGVHAAKKTGLRKGLSPYAGVGKLFEVESEWLDYYGNRLSGNAGKLEISKMHTGYSDKLHPIATWPSVTVQWEVQKISEYPELLLLLQFDSSRYEAEDGQRNADQTLLFCQSLFDQLMDLNGIELSIEHSLLEEGDFQFEEEEWLQLTGWLFLDPGSILNYLQRVSSGEHPRVPEEEIIRFTFSNKKINTKQLFPLTVNLCFRRTKQFIMEGMEKIEGILETKSKIPPHMILDNSGTRTLEKFASRMEKAFEEEYGLRVMASGTDLNCADTPLHVIRLGEHGVSVQFSDKPVIGVIRPVSNRLWSSGKPIPLKIYTTEGGLEPTSVCEKSFTDIDVDRWLKIVLLAVDDMLTLRNAAAIYLADQGEQGQSNYLEQIQKSKEQLAKNLSYMLIPVFADEERKLSQKARENLRQKLLNKLGSFYQVHAVLDYMTEVNRGIVETSRKAPRFYGQAKIEMERADLDVMFSDGKIDLDKPQGNMAVSVSAQELARSRTGEVISNIQGKIGFHITHLEHDVHEMRNIKEFEASKWLGFVTKEEVKADMGDLAIPMVLRSYPDSPLMITQKDLSVGGSEKIYLSESSDYSELLKWDYSFNYSLSYHYPQDILHCKILWNQHGTVKSDVSDRLFEALAQFTEVYPYLKKDMDREAAIVNPEGDIKPIQKILSAFSIVLNEVAQASNLLMTVKKRDDKSECYSFHIAETSVDIDGRDVYMIKIYGEKLKGEIIPEILLDTQCFEAVPYKNIETTEQNILEEPMACYIYRYKDTEEYLSPAEGQEIKERTVCLRGLNLLEMQNALAQISVIRNSCLMQDSSLDKNREIAEPFIYSTGNVAFENPYFAFKDISQKLDIKPKEKKCTISCCFEEFFKDLFRESCGKEMKIQMEAKYIRNIQNGLAPIELPIFLQTPVMVKAGATKEITREWECKIQQWIYEHYENNPEENSSLRFDLILFSSLTPMPKKLLRFQNLWISYGSHNSVQ